jgi:hypothetical protein
MRRRKKVVQRKMHTPIDELMEEDEVSEAASDNHEFDVQEVDEDLDELQSRPERVSSRMRKTNSTVQTPSFMDRPTLPIQPIQMIPQYLSKLS